MTFPFCHWTRIHIPKTRIVSIVLKRPCPIMFTQIMEVWRHWKIFKNKSFHCSPVTFFLKIVKYFFHRNSRWFSVSSRLGFKTWLPKKSGGSRKPLSIKHGSSPVLWLSISQYAVWFFFESTTQWSNYLPQGAKVLLLTLWLHGFLSPQRANVTQWSNYLPQRAKVMTQRLHAFRSPRRAMWLNGRTIYLNRQRFWLNDQI